MNAGFKNRIVLFAITAICALFLGVFLLKNKEKNADAQTLIKVGVIAGPMVEVMQEAQSIAARDFNMKLEIVSFGDYQMPNEALSAGDIDANVFQTLSFFEIYKKNRGSHLAVLGKTFIYPMGIYSTKISSLTAVKKGGTVGLPNDPSNEGRALLLLQNAGLIKLRENVGEFAQITDIVENSYNLKFYTIEASQLVRIVNDTDLAVLNNDFVKLAGFTAQQEIFVENAQNAQRYANIIAVREADLNKEALLNLKKILNSEAIIKVTEKIAGNAIPVW